MYLYCQFLLLLCAHATQLSTEYVAFTLPGAGVISRNWNTCPPIKHRKVCLHYETYAISYALLILVVALPLALNFVASGEDFALHATPKPY